MIRYAVAAVTAATLAYFAVDLLGETTRDRERSFTLLAGAVFGIVLQRSRFCFASAFRDLFLLRDRRVALGVLAALAVGSLGYTVVFGAQLPDPSRYLPATAHIVPASWVILLGGLSFAIGMVLAGGCVSGSLCRLGEGSLVAPVTLLACVPGCWLAFSLWNFFYVKSLATAPVVWLPQHLGYGGALALQLAVIGGLAAILFWKCAAVPQRAGEPVALRDAIRKIFKDGWPTGLAGAALGILGTSLFFRAQPMGVTSELGRFSRLSGNAMGILPGRLEGLDRMAGCRPIMSDACLTENGIFVLALVAGSFLAALLANEFRIRVGRPRTYGLAAAGGVLIGFGAMTSLGCTVGTLLSGIMAFSLHGWIFAVGLLGGAWAGTQILRRIA
jgi:uncharacterized membrane protein YedE/YeeE